MTYTTKMGLAIAVIGTLTFVHSSNCEASATFKHYTCSDLTGGVWNKCITDGGNQDACNAAQDYIGKDCKDD